MTTEHGYEHLDHACRFGSCLIGGSMTGVPEFSVPLNAPRSASAGDTPGSSFSSATCRLATLSCSLASGCAAQEVTHAGMAVATLRSGPAQVEAPDRWRLDQNVGYTYFI
jgi:hypothetical protein